MNCPYCNFSFRRLLSNAPPTGIPADELIPVLCERCKKVCLFLNGQVRAITSEELAALKESPAWKAVIGPALQIMNANQN